MLGHNFWYSLEKSHTKAWPCWCGSSLDICAASLEHWWVASGTTRSVWPHTHTHTHTLQCSHFAGDIDGLLTATSFSSLPTGASSDPIELVAFWMVIIHVACSPPPSLLRELHVSAVWPHMSEETVVDNATQSYVRLLFLPTFSVFPALLYLTYQLNYYLQGF